MFLVNLIELEGTVYISRDIPYRSLMFQDSNNINTEQSMWQENLNNENYFQGVILRNKREQFIFAFESYPNKANVCGSIFDKIPSKCQSKVTISLYGNISKYDKIPEDFHTIVKDNRESNGDMMIIEIHNAKTNKDYYGCCYNYHDGYHPYCVYYGKEHNKLERQWI